MAIKWETSESAYTRLRGVCPFVDWALASDKSGFFPMDVPLPEGRERRLPVLLRLREITPTRFASGDDFFPTAEGRSRWRARVRVPALYTLSEFGGGERIVCTALVTRWFFEELGRNDMLLAAVIRVTLGLPLREESLPAVSELGDGVAR